MSTRMILRSMPSLSVAIIVVRFAVHLHDERPTAPASFSRFCAIVQKLRADERRSRQQTPARRARPRDRACSPFLREAIAALPAIAETLRRRAAPRRRSSRWRWRPASEPSRSSCAAAARAWRWPSRSAIWPANWRSSRSLGCCPISPTRRSTGALARRDRRAHARAPSRRASRSSRSASSAAASSIIRPTSTCILLFDPERLPRRDARGAGRGGGADRPAAGRAAPEAHRRRLCRPGRPAPAARRPK